MSSGKWRPFCLGLNVLLVLETTLYTCRLLWKPIPWIGYLYGMHQMVVLCGQSQWSLFHVINSSLPDIYFIILPPELYMTSSNGNIFGVTGHLCGEFTGEFTAQRPVTLWIPRTQKMFPFDDVIIITQHSVLICRSVHGTWWLYQGVSNESFKQAYYMISLRAWWALNLCIIDVRPRNYMGTTKFQQHEIGPHLSQHG